MEFLVVGWVRGVVMGFVLSSDSGKFVFVLVILWVLECRRDFELFVMFFDCFVCFEVLY